MAKPRDPIPEAEGAVWWNVALDKVVDRCTLYWLNKAPGGPAYLESLHEMTVQCVELNWEDVRQSIRLTLEKLPDNERTYAQAQAEAEELFRIYRSEAIVRGGDWNRPFPKTQESTPVNTEVVPSPSEKTEYTVNDTIEESVGESVEEPVKEAVTEPGEIIEKKADFNATWAAKLKSVLEATEPQNTLTPDAPREVCRFFVENDWCSYGDKCPKSHVPKAGLSRLISEPFEEPVIKRKFKPDSQRDIKRRARSSSAESRSIKREVTRINRPCKYFASGSGCRNGLHCPFVHKKDL